ncbi:MAG: PqqD family protein [Lachnospiraceae bacterium]|nr:PqqD family protein [Lachnospiraceae bacterium]
MRLKDGYLLKEIMDEYVLFPSGQNVVDGKKIVSLNESGVFIAKHLQNDIPYKSLLKLFLDEYEATTDEEIEMLQFDLDHFLDNLWRRDMLITD